MLLSTVCRKLPALELLSSRQCMRVFRAGPDYCPGNPFPEPYGLLHLSFQSLRIHDIFPWQVRCFHSIPRSASLFSTEGSGSSLLSGVNTNSNIVPVRGKKRKGKVFVPFEYRPLRYLRQYGLVARWSTPGGRMMIMRRILKGRKHLTHG